MKLTQKCIKYLAIALAFSIIISIFVSLFSIFGIFDSNDKDGNINTNNDYSNIYDYKEIKDLEIELNKADLIIKEGNELKIETDSNRIKINKRNHKIYIKERGLLASSNSEVVIYIPTDHIFNEVDIDTGIGKLELNDLSTNELSLELGAGKVNINNILVYNETDIDGGAGEVIIKNSNLTNLDLDIGIGKFDIEAELAGKNEIDSGVGEVNIFLTNGIVNYTIIAEKGIGKINLNGNIIENNVRYGSGKTLLEINGGIGNINIE